MKPIYPAYLFHSSALVVFATILSQTNSVFAQDSNIVPDSTLGAESSVVNNRDENSKSIIDGGAIRGSNLFHSFQEFNVGADRGVYFANPDAVNNIFSRVTGKNVSNILGTLGVDGAANLYLINPNGIVFGENSSLDVQGSFTATTAERVEFGDNGFFSAVASGESLLTISVPLGLQFGSNPKSIVNRSFSQDETGDYVGLQVPSGEKLTLVGGDISFEAGEATARGGNINIGGLSKVGRVSLSDNSNLSFPDNAVKADVTFTDTADVDVRGTGRGNINIDAGNLNIEAGDSGSSQIRAGVTVDSTSTKLQTGDITINVAKNVTVDDSVIQNQVDFKAVGNAGNIKINANSLQVLNGGQLSSSISGQGNAGNIIIQVTDAVTFDGRDDSDSASGAFSNVKTNAEGNAGGIEIIARSLSLTNRAQLSNSTAGIGNAGNIDIQVKEKTILGNSSIISEVSAPNDNGNGGNGGFGEGGDITIQANSLLLEDGSSILTDTENVGNAGDITIEVEESVIMDGEGLGSFADDTNVSPSQITSTVDRFESAEGKGGNISISTSFLSITDDGFISTDTYSRGNAGNILINAEFLNLNQNSSISSLSESTFNAGNITLNVANSLQATDSSISTSSFQSSGGNLTITTQDIQLRGDSDLTTDISLGEGSGGNIAIKTDSIIAFDDSDIFAFAGDGQGGNINLDTPAFFAENFTLNSLTADPDTLNNNSRADVNATGEISSGTVDIPDVSFIQNSLTELPNNSLNTDELVANSCVVPVGDRSQGKFIISGGEGLPVRPGGNLPSKYPTGEVRGVTEDNTSSWQPGDPIVEPQGAYRLANGKMVLSRECL